MQIESTAFYASGGYPAVIIGGLLILVITAIIVKIFELLIRRGLDAASPGRGGGTIFLNILRIIIWTIGVSAVLKACLGFDPTVIWGALGIGGVALSLGLQSTISNLLAGVQITFSHSLELGDWVKIGTSPAACIKDISWRITTLEDEYGNQYYVPNSVMNTTTVEKLRTECGTYLDLVIARDADMKLIEDSLPQIAFDALGNAGMRYEDLMPKLFIMGTSMEGITAQLKVYTHRDYDTIAISDTVMPSVIAFLQEHDAMAHMTNMA